MFMLFFSTNWITHRKSWHDIACLALRTSWQSVSDTTWNKEDSCLLLTQRIKPEESSVSILRVIGLMWGLAFLLCSWYMYTNFSGPCVYVIHDVFAVYFKGRWVFMRNGDFCFSLYLSTDLIYVKSSGSLVFGTFQRPLDSFMWGMEILSVSLYISTVVWFMWRVLILLFLWYISTVIGFMWWMAILLLSLKMSTVIWFTRGVAILLFSLYISKVRSILKLFVWAGKVKAFVF